MPRRLFIDTDTASDDAVALMMAFKHAPESLVGISIVAGNVPLDQGVQNALYTRELYGLDTPIYSGAKEPLHRPLETAQFVHGEDGMGDIGLDISGRTADDGCGIHALIGAANQYSGELELVTLGPLTNIAHALDLDHELASKIKQCYIMGGTSDYYGNITPVSEFNVWADPEAADAVFTSDMPKTMIGWDISRKYAVINDQEADDIRTIGPIAEVAMNCQITVRQFCEETTGLDGFDLPDPIAMAVALCEDMVLADTTAAVSVVTNDGPTRGMVVVDDRQFTDQSQSTRLILEADRDRFLTLLRDAFVQ